MNPLSTLRFWGQFLQTIGVVPVIVGACGLIVAAALPWATLTVFKQPIQIPGLLGFGALTAAIGLLALAQLGAIRRFPWLGIALGIAAFGVGQRSAVVMSSTVVRYLLSIEMGLAPINYRLAQLNVQPIEPFGQVIGSREDHMGIGPGYTQEAGALLAAGSLVLLAGGRVRRTCRFCKHAWSIRHGDKVAFCPRCGKHSGTMRTCPRCAAGVERHDHFCVQCGENIPAIGNKTPRLQA